MSDEFIEAETTPDFSAAPLELVPEPQPKRRGRPPGSSTGTRTTRRSTRKKDLTDQIGGYLMMLNMGFMFLPDPWSNDALDHQEITALAKALNDYAQSNATAYKYLSTVLVSGGSIVNLLTVTGAIIARRAARHGVLPESLDESFGMIIETASN